MSEYTPITGELRAAMRQWGWVESDGSITFTSSSMPPSIDAEQSLAISGSDFDRYCDAIDSIHAQLERENAALRSSAAHAYASGYEYAEQDRDGWVKLPVDADGEVIYAGDKLVGYGKTIEVVELRYDRSGWVLISKDGNAYDEYADTYAFSHHQPDTWERIIEDAIGEGMARQRNNDSGNFCERANPMNNGDLVARCKALSERTKDVGA